MLRRLLALLLILGLAAPALAVPQHCGPVKQKQASAHHGHHQTKPDAPAKSNVPPHECIGCIAPYSGGLAPIAEPFIFASEPRAAIAGQLGALAVRPALPPPRG